jgi:exodeoxyribonuclease III
MRLVTWNVNSLAVRMPRLLEFLELHLPDVALLQETKCAADAFPSRELRSAGYDAVHHSGGRWAGVAILAREGLELRDPLAGLKGELMADEARWIEASVDGIRVASTYVTNGRAIGTPQFDEKLAFLDAIAARASQLRDDPLIVAGDFNVAPADVDVYDPAAFVGGTHVTADERDRVERALAAGGLVDAYRTLHPDEQQFTWWDYRQGHFHRGMGLRIDLILMSEALGARLTRCGIERDFRKGLKPSDHAPLVAEFEA